MSIAQGICTSFKEELFKGTHKFDGSQTFRVALYGSTADLNVSTTAYTSSGEVSGTNYVAKGATSAPTMTTDGSMVIIDFADVSWSSSTITARGALLYNDTSSGDKSVAVLNFGEDKKSSASTFTIKFPTPNDIDGFIRITSSG